MIFTNKQLKEANRKLSPEAQSFIDDAETTELIGNLLVQAGLNEEQRNDADSEVLYAMLGLQTLQEAIENISKISGKSIAELSQLKKDLEENVFSKIPATPKQLPTNLQSFVDSGEWKNGVAKIGRQFNLKEEQISKLEGETLKVLNCSEMPSSFKENIKRELGLDENAGRRIADSINGSVFARVMGDIKMAWAPQGKPVPMSDMGKTEDKFEIVDNLSEEMMRKAMQPAGMAPTNLPTAPTTLPTTTIPAQPMSDIGKPGQDPYREALE